MLGNILAIILFVSYISCVSLCLALEIRAMIKLDKEYKNINNKFKK